MMLSSDVELVDRFSLITRPVGIDIETTARNGKMSSPFRDRIVSIAMSDGERSWITTGEDGFRSLAPILADPGTTKIFHNAAFDLQFLTYQYGMEIDRGSLWDTLLVERILMMGEPPTIRHSLDDVLARRLGVMIDKSLRTSFAEQTGELTREQVGYIVSDVKHLPRLRDIQIGLVSALQLGKVVDLECRLVPVVVGMTLAGVGFDHALWEQYQKQIRARLRTLERNIHEADPGLPVQTTLFGDIQLGINLNSQPQVVKWLNSRGVSVWEIDKLNLAGYLKEHPKHQFREAIELFMEWKTWQHMLSQDYSKFVIPETGRIHSSWNQIEADTGRFSSSKPNMQNVERPEEDKPNKRLLFLPAKGNVFVVADYNQQEPRILAQLSKDPELRRACQEDDVYTALAQVVYGHAVTRKDKERQDMKVNVLATFYGMGAYDDATVEIQRRIKQAFPIALRFVEAQVNHAVQNALVRTALGRVRHFPDMRASDARNRMNWRLANIARNTPIQGTGADMIKLALVRFAELISPDKVIGEDMEIIQMQAHPALVVHDEIVVECPEGEAEKARELLVRAMEEAGQMLCPDVKMPVESLISPRWGKA